MIFSDIEIEKEINSCFDKPIAYSTQGYPYNKLDDRQFEILLYSIFKKEIDNGHYTDQYDNITLMTGVGEQGRDCALHFRGASVGLIQCKQYSGRINKPEVAREIIKFALYYLKDKTLITDLNNFTYYFAVSNDFTGNALDLLADFGRKITKEGKLENWITEVIQKYRALASFKSEQVITELCVILGSLKIKKIVASDLNIKLAEFPELAPLFFEMRTVVREERVLKQYQEITQNLGQIGTTLNELSSGQIEHVFPLHFEADGYQTQFDRPSKLPRSNDFVGREKIIENLKFTAQTTRIIAILGMPGIGKSALMGKLASELNPDDVFEYEFIEGLISPDDLLRQLARFVDKKSGQKMRLTHTLRTYLFQQDYLTAINLIITHLNRSKSYLFFDSIHDIQQNKPLIAIFKQLKTKLQQGTIFVAGRSKPIFYTKLDETKSLVKSFELGGLSKSEIKAFFVQKNISVDDKVLEVLTTRLDGLPIALEIVLSLMVGSIPNETLLKLLSETEKQMIEHLFEEVYEQLSPIERSLLTIASLFNFPFLQDELPEAHQTIFPKIDGQAYGAKKLRQRFLLQEFSSKYYRVHKVIQNLARKYSDRLDEYRVRLACYLLENSEDDLRARLEAITLLIQTEGFELASYILVPLIYDILIPYYPNLAEIYLNRFREDLISSERWLWMLGSQGDLASFWRRYNEAENCYLKMLEQARELGEEEAVAVALQNLGVLYYRQDDHRAEQCYLDSLAIKEKLNDLEGQAQLYNNLGAFYHHKHRFNEAQLVLEKGLELRKKCKSSELSKYRLYANLGQLYVKQEQLEQARQYFERVYQITADMGLPHEVANAIYNLAKFEADTGNYKVAEQHLLKMLNIAQQHNLWQVKELALNAFILYSFDLGNYDKAIEYSQKAIKVQEKIGNETRLAVLYFDLGSVYYRKKDYIDAAHYYELGLELFENLKQAEQIQVFLSNTFQLTFDLPNPKPIVIALKNLKNRLLKAAPSYSLAKVYETLGKIYLEVLNKDRVGFACLNQAIAIFIQIENYHEQIEVLIELGIAYTKRKRYGNALAIYEQAIEQAKEFDSVTLLSIAYFQRGNCLAQIEVYEQSLIDYERAFKLSEEYGDLEQQKLYHHNLGVAHRIQGNLKEAIKWLNLALATYRQNSDLENKIEILSQLGLSYWALHEEEEGLICFNKALQLSRQTHYHSKESEILITLGKYYFENNEPEKAKDFYQQALKVTRTVGNVILEEDIILSLGYVHHELGTFGDIKSQFEDVMKKSKKLKHYENLVKFCTLCAKIEFEEGDIESAAYFFYQAAIIALMASYEKILVLEKYSEYTPALPEFNHVISQFVKNVDQALKENKITQAQQLYHNLLSRLQNSVYSDVVESFLFRFIEAIGKYLSKLPNETLLDFVSSAWESNQPDVDLGEEEVA